ncbi:unnamed protein product [Heligmosomoides polygyrus]|uniref:HAD-like domain-containing protein n=1 Tax=Heligmosomoides polygyrus TaxID=6339 RepID=A0A183FUW6_HELPZ|nr:unnamed protein product [Heligmosomoides polygyrus]
MPDESHMLQAQFRCRGQDFPSVKGGPSFALPSGKVAGSMTAGELVAALPHPAKDFPIECVQDAARVFSIWSQPGSKALKCKRILYVGDRIVDPRSIGLAYAAFKSHCGHVNNMARVLEPATIMRHGSLTGGWPEVLKRLFELG